MRLTLQEQHAVGVAARDTLPSGSRVSLFGSRTDDNARGGDIDLLVDCPPSMAAGEWVVRRQAFVARLYRLIGERRIDVLVAGPAALEPPSSVLSSARRQATLLVQT
jgi:uncharacterized protein